MSKEAMTTTQERAGVEAMQTLLQRLESLTAPSRDVSDELLLSWGWQKNPPNILGMGWLSPDGTWYGTFDEGRPHPTASIDDAKLGLPKGSLWATGSMEDGPFARVMVPRSDGFYTGQSDNASRACTEAIALCIAIVKARGGV